MLVGKMADEEPAGEDAPKKKSKLPLIVGLVLALAGGGGGFFAVQTGMILGGDAAPTDAEAAPKDHAAEETPITDTAFVPVDQLVISLGSGSGSKHLLFKSQLEVGKAHEEEVTALLPRVVDVLNSYLRAVDMRDLEDPAALLRLRAQMLRRVQTVVGGDRVRDLLIMEFVLN